MYQQIFPNYGYYPQYQYHSYGFQPCYNPWLYNCQPPERLILVRKQEIISTNVMEKQSEDCNQSQPHLKSELQSKDQENSVSISQGQEKTLNLRPNLLIDSTNVQKNFSKAIIQYILRQKNSVQKILGESKGEKFLSLMNRLVNKLRNLFHIVRYTDDEAFLKTVRILGNNFLRKEGASYIYNSKIRQKTSHIKHKAIVKKVLMKL